MTREQLARGVVMNSDDHIEILETAPTVEAACQLIRELGVDIGLLKREHEGCKAWGHDWEYGVGVTERYLDARELRAMERAFRTLAEHVEAAAAAREA